MFVLFLILNFILYSVYALASYSESFKNTQYFYPVCLLISISGNFLWLLYVKNIDENSKIYVNGAIWDLAIGISFFIVPFLFYSIKLKPIAYVGLFLIVIGTGLMKYGEIEDNLKSAKEIKKNT